MPPKLLSGVPLEKEKIRVKFDDEKKCGGSYHVFASSIGLAPVYSSIGNGILSPCTCVLQISLQVP